MTYYDFKEIGLSLKGDARYCKFIEIVDANRPFYSEKTVEQIDITLERPSFTQKYGFRAGSIAEALGVDLATITRMKKPSFIVSAKVFQELCHGIFHCSCQQILFNDKDGISVLPKRIGVAARAMENIMLHERADILKQIAGIRLKYEAEHGPYIISRPTIPWIRVKEYSEEILSPVSTCLGDYAGCRVGLILSKLQKVNDNSRCGPHLDTLMFLSWAMGTTVDSLMVQDYTKITAIGYRYADSVIRVSDSIICKTIGHLLNLPENIQSKCIALIFYACEGHSAQQVQQLPSNQVNHENRGKKPRESIYRPVPLIPRITEDKPSKKSN